MLSRRHEHPRIGREASHSIRIPWLARKLQLGWVKQIVVNTYSAFSRHRHWTNAAALAFFFFLSLIPLLVFLASFVAYLRIPNLFGHVLDFFSGLVPGDAMRLVRDALADVLTGHRKLISLGILGSIWAASAGFNALIGALNSAYLVKEGRPFWRRQLLAMALTVTIGAMVGTASLFMVLGGRFGWWLADVLRLDPIVGLLWPYIRWTAALLFTVLSAEVLYFIAPNSKQRFRRQIGGAVLAVTIWLAGSYGLQLYLQSFAQMSWVYGTLRAVVALMLWLYIGAAAILIGAELNVQLLKSRTGLKIRQKEELA